jgi:hypothetical protein
MISSLRNLDHKDHQALRASFELPLRMMARRAVRVWFNHDRLDQVLSECLAQCPQCELIYAIDIGGRQVSSNIAPDSIDRSAYGQDLSRRPYSVSVSVLNNAAFGGAFLCDAYISQVTKSLCVTVMYGVTMGQTTLGFVAADLDPRNLPRL